MEEFSAPHNIFRFAFLSNSSFQYYAPSIPQYLPLPIVGTKTWNSLLNQPAKSLDETLFLDSWKLFQEEYRSQKVVFTAFLFQFKQYERSFLSYSKFWFQLSAKAQFHKKAVILSVFCAVGKNRESNTVISIIKR